VLIGSSGPFQHAPCSLLPCPFPEPLFRQAEALSKPFSELIDSVSRDTEWLLRVVRTTVGHDEFTRRLVEICEQVLAEELSQPLQLTLNRSDYMIDEPSGRLLQVELNTISVSFPSLAAKLTSMHRDLIGRLGATIGPADRETLVRTRPDLATALGSSPDALDEALPANISGSAVARGLSVAHLEYCGGKARPRVVVLMVVAPDERNVVDQRGIEHQLWRAHRVPLVRASLSQIAERATLGDGRRLRLRLEGGDDVEVSVVYLRAGYAPTDYPGDAEWAARLLLERSHAIKCPSVQQQLAGTKKVQQELARPGELERFVSREAAAAMRPCFAGLHGLDEDGGDAVESAVRAAISEPARFVLKPQREGGGNNLYGDEVSEALERMSAAERASFILMERIRPPSVPMPLMRSGELDGGACTCELGMYGFALGDGTRMLANEPAGHLLRVKLESVDEGGVCAGFAVLSSPALYMPA
jgi:glutathione synthetase